MSVRHAAMVIVVGGWIMLVPPLTRYDRNGKPDWDASLQAALDEARRASKRPAQCDPELLPSLTYKTRVDCEREREEVNQTAKDKELWRKARCVPVESYCFPSKGSTPTE